MSNFSFGNAPVPVAKTRSFWSPVFWVAVPLWLIVALLSSCSGEKGPGPDIIEQPVMMTVLGDVAKAEEYATQRAGRDSTLVYSRELMLQYKRVFAKHKINRQRFFKSINYYLSKPYLAKDMFDSLQAQVRRNAYDRMPAQIDN
jgi:Domain of unknown function (DUF4296)